MSELLGEVTCPSGVLVLTDGGYLGLWSGERSPDETQEPDTVPAVDFEIVGPDAAVAARSFDRQSGQLLYDIPQRSAAEFAASFDEHCREHGHDASLRPFARRVPHRDRVRRAVAGGDADFLVTGVPMIVVSGLPTDRPLPVTATTGTGWGWTSMRIAVTDAPVASVRAHEAIAVDNARFAFADADALTSWVHEEPIDGLADVVFWGADEDEVAAEFGAVHTGTTGDDQYGWLNLPADDAYEKAVALQVRQGAEPKRRFAFDFRPHSHHWEVMAGVRASEREAATIAVGGAQIMFAMTSVGDGYFPVHLELDADGALAGILITVQSDDDED